MKSAMEYLREGNIQAAVNAFGGKMKGKQVTTIQPGQYQWVIRNESGDIGFWYPVAVSAKVKLVGLGDLKQEEADRVDALLPGQSCQLSRVYGWFYRSDEGLLMWRREAPADMAALAQAADVLRGRTIWDKTAHNHCKVVSIGPKRVTLECGKYKGRGTLDRLLFNQRVASGVYSLLSDNSEG